MSDRKGQITTQRIFQGSPHFLFAAPLYRSDPLPARISGPVGPGNHREVTVELGDRASGAAPGQMAALMDGDLIVGWGTITR